MPNLIVLFNHTLTAEQVADAGSALGVARIIEPPPGIRRLWGQVPPDPPTLREYLAPVCRWLDETAAQGDFVLVQGEFGATFLLAGHCLRKGYIPLYSTTRRQAVEKHLGGGAVEVSHLFSHVRFRRYETSSEPPDPEDGK